ncbi:fibronectin type III domain-containing protein [Mangrovibacterium lignilyticum]|uniref:fibronectin type III domain-containing protein n=1 Tax=Mangrovibacterium lignilyticum TaxID=2668052 RepID=UPI0013D87DA4|nr:fibronectin type III domain-containing protein [Mangrovibacterium lignilyticum]
MNKVLTSFSPNRLTDSELIVLSGGACSQMNGNPHFPTPSPELITVQTATDEFLTADEKSKTGSHQDVAIKNQKRKNLEKLLHALAVYVNLTADGDEAILLSSGFELAKKAEAVGPLDAPEGLQVKAGNARGSLSVSCKRVAGAGSYGFEYRQLQTESDNGWIRVDSTKHNILVTGLVSGGQYAFRVMAIGSNPQRNWSNEVSSFVL